MPHRDPETGQFVAGGGSSMEFSDVEVVSFEAAVGIEASNLSGATGFQGGAQVIDGSELIDYDEVVDRNETLHLIDAQHYLRAWINSTGTADGTVRVVAEVSTAASRQMVGNLSTDSIDGDAANVIKGDPEDSDSIDLVGRPLNAVGHQPFSDTGSGAGGAGSAGDDRVTLTNPPRHVGRFHPRDELFLNARINHWNISDAGLHFDLFGQHTYGVETA